LHVRGASRSSVDLFVLLPIPMALTFS
jgi:hypothetical protein